MLQLQSLPVQKGVQEISPSCERCILQPGACIPVVMRPGMTTMDPPPSVIHIDQNLLLELCTRFPEVPKNVIIALIQQVILCLRRPHGDILYIYIHVPYV